MKLITHTPKIWTIQNFLSLKECEDIIFFSEHKGYDEAKVSLSSGAKMLKGIRNNYRLIYTDEVLAQKYWTKVKAFCPSKIEEHEVLGLNEQFRFYRYEENQRFKRHIDGRFKRNSQEESRITFMIYLNEDFEGGQTAFDDITIEPKTGSALCFIHEQKHESTPIKKGTKYVLRSDIMYKIPTQK